jgi:predicted Zn-dependent protease
MLLNLNLNLNLNFFSRNKHFALFTALCIYLPPALSKQSKQTIQIVNPVPAIHSTQTKNNNSIWDETTIESFLKAEFLAQDKQFETAALILWDKAQKQPLPVLLDRVVQWSVLSKRMDMSYDAAKLWEKTSPNSAKAQEWLTTLLVLNERYDDLSLYLSTRYNPSKPIPKNTDLINLIVLIRSLKLPEAQQHLLYKAVQKGFKTHNHLGDVQFLYGTLAQQANLTDDAKKHFYQATTAASPNSIAILTLASTQPTTALAAAKIWTKRQPNNVDAWHTLAQIHIALKQAKAAATAFNQAVKALPKLDSQTVYFLLARMEQERLSGQFELVKASLAQAYRARKTLTQHSQAKIARMLAQELGQSVEALDIFYLAEKLNNKVDTSENDDTESSANTSEGLLIKGLSLAVKAKLGDRKALDELLALQASIQHSADSKIINKITNKTINKTINSHLENSSNMAYILTYAAIDTLRTIAYRGINTLTEQLQVQTDFDLVLRLCKQLPEGDGLYETAITYELMNKTDASVALLRDLLLKSPKNAALLNALGYTLVDRHINNAQLIEGIQLLETAYALNTDSMAINDSLGWGYFRVKQYDKALPLLKKAYTIKSDGEVAAHFGELLFVMGNPKVARVVWFKAYQADSLHPALLNTMKRFKIPFPTLAVKRSSTLIQNK